MAKKSEDDRNWDKCNGCVLCCTNVALEMDKPTTKEEYDQIIWFLMHKNVAVYIDNEGDWLLEYDTVCEALDKNGRCKKYKKRPKVCREYSHEDCLKYGEGKPHRTRWDKPEQFERWLKRKGIDYKFKKFK